MEILAMGSAAVAVLAWFFRLEGRVYLQAQQIADIKADHKDAVKQLRDDVAYIRQRIDSVLGMGV